jgi:hydrogenase maturation protease
LGDFRGDRPSACGAPRITVLGIGNTMMGDDGVGVAVAEDLAAAGPGENVRIVTAPIPGMSLMTYFLESDLVIIVDAVITKAEAGAIFRFHPGDAGTMNPPSNHAHGVGIFHLLTTARLKGANPEVVIYGVQIGEVCFRDRQLSPAVVAAARRVLELLSEEISSWKRR